jgi:hypothetical protein
MKIKHKMSVVELRMLRWISRNIRKDRIRNEEIFLKIGMTPINEKMRENHLRWFGHVQRIVVSALGTKSELIKVEGMKKIEKDLK